MRDRRFDGMGGHVVRDAGWGGSIRIRVECGGVDTGDRADKVIEASGGSVKDDGQRSTMVWIGTRWEETRDCVRNAELPKGRLEGFIVVIWGTQGGGGGATEKDSFWRATATTSTTTTLFDNDDNDTTSTTTSTTADRRYDDG